MKYKLIVSDYDGTLIKKDGTISQSQISAIQDYVSRGGIFAIITGRMTASILPLAKKLGLSGLIASFNGGEVTDIQTGKHLYSHFIPCQNAVEIFKVIEQENAYAQAYRQENYYCYLKTEITDLYEKLTGVKGVVLNQKLSSYLNQNSFDTHKILVMDKKEVLDTVYPKLLPFSDKLNVIRSNDIQIEITDKNTSKAGALKFLAENFNIDISQTIAVGDGGNDASMLAFAGLGIAVSNAEVLAKESAKIVLEYSNEQDAIARIIEKYTF